jgi:iron(II)-dependent oxidoreductase
MIACVGVLLALAMSSEATAVPVAPQRVIVEANIFRNAIDGSGHYGCRISVEAETGNRRELWFTFGEVMPHPEGGWETIGASSRCGNGTFAAVAPGFTSLIGIPYLIVDLSTAPALRPSGDIDLAASIKMQKLSAFDQNGEPLYARSAHDRTLDIESGAQLTLPLIVSDERETEALGVHEVLVRLRAEALAPTLAAAYGTLSVTADVPGAQILLDGGLVGRTSEGSPAVVDNVLVGKREVSVRDLSGREARKQIDVKEGQTVEATFDLLGLSSGTTGKALVMGSPEGTGQPHERPQHRVYVSEFLIDKTEVTWRQFRKFAELTATLLPPERSWGTPDHYPVSSVNWEQAKSYCEWAGGRLPTEAEWEKAARGLDGLTYPWGNDWDPDRCNSWIGGTNRPFEVGTFPYCLSPYGVLDMAGNMWEWCSDPYQEEYYADSPGRDPKGPPSGRFYVQRGGDWISQPLLLRSAHRYRMTPTSQYQSNGFRCVHDRED